MGNEESDAKNWRGKQLVERDFSGQDLTDADFTSANLTGASFRKAKLEGALLEDAILTGADLYEAEAKSLEKTLELRRDLLPERSSSLRTMALAAMSFLVYTAIAIITSKDESVLSNTGTMQIPVLDAEVSPHAFFISTCVVGLALVTYIQLQVVVFAELVASVPGRFPDGYRLHLLDLVDAWVVSLLRMRPESTASKAKILTRLAWASPRIAVRWLLPLTIALTGWRFAAAAASYQIALLAVLLALSILVNVLVPGQVERAFGRTRHGFSARTAAAALLMVVILGVRPTLWRRLDPYWPSGLQFAALEGASLAGSNFSNTNFFSANLKSANLHRARLDQAYLHDANLEGADLRRASARGVYAPDANLTDANLRYADFSLANLHEAKLTGIKAGSAKFAGARLQKAVLARADLFEADLFGVQAAWADFTDASIKDGADLRYADLQGAWLSGLDGWNTKYSFADLTGAHLDGASLGEKSEFIGIVARDADFTKATLANQTIQEGNFEGATFSEASLSGTTFMNVSLRDARFPNAHAAGLKVLGGSLEGASFKNADLYSATFEGVDLTQTSFEGARLGNAKFKLPLPGLTRAQLALAAVPPSPMPELGAP